MTEFKDAIEQLKDPVLLSNLGHGSGLFPLNTIIHALRIADRLMGEPSDEMLQSAYESLGWDFTNDFGFRHSFKAMRDQLLREIEQEQQSFCGMKVICDPSMPPGSFKIVTTTEHNPADNSQNEEW